MSTLCSLALLCLSAQPAEEHFHDVALDSIELVAEGGAAQMQEAPSWRIQGVMRPAVVFDGDAHRAGAEGFIVTDRWNYSRENLSEMHLVVAAPPGVSPAGRVFLPRTDRLGYDVLRFRLDPGSASEEARSAFRKAQASYYRELLEAGVLGAAWFRHRHSAILAEAGTDGVGGVGAVGMEEEVRQRFRARTEAELESSYQLFSGGRAIAENVQLDRELFGIQEQEHAVAVDSLGGISVKEFDWAALVAGLEVEVDSLASFIPVDQHALFFPSFGAMVALLDEARAVGTPFLRLLEPRAEDARTQERYERQLCVGLDVLARAFGPQVIRSIAFTGSDPYLRMGSDVGLLFECAQPALVMADLERRRTQAVAELGAAETPGVLSGVPYKGVRNEERSISSYVASLGEVVIVSNSLAQLERLIRAQQGEEPSLDESGEYRFFRHRYPRSAEQTALLLVSDAALRRWCGPKWRIGASRRTRAAAVLAEYDARTLLERRKSSDKTPLQEYTGELSLPTKGKLWLDERGVRSEEYGTFLFQTPILELSIDKVSESEANAYRRFRDGYQSNWSNYFDPIAAQIRVESGTLELDLSIMPLIAATEYREFIDLCGDVKLAAGAGDPHAESLLHLVFAIDSDSDRLRSWTGMASAMVPGLEANPLAWIKSSVSLYADGDPLWKEWIAAEDRGEFIESSFHRLPLGLHFDSKNPIALAAFLAALRGFIDQTAPGMLLWENRKHEERPYVCVKAAPAFAGQQEGLEKLELFYASMPDGLTFALGEDLIRRAIGRSIAKSGGEGAEAAEVLEAQDAWLGENVALRASPGVRHLLELLWSSDMRDQLRLVSYANLPILDEWRRLWPDRDPVEVYEEIFGTRPICPGGGEYAYNSELNAMESTAYGHPLAPREGPGVPAELGAIGAGDFGLTFEREGLRARARLTRGE